MNSSAGGAEIGQELAQGAAQETLQGQQYYTQALTNFLNERQSFFQGDVPLAENAAQGQLSATQANQQVAGQVAADAFQAPQLQNAYQLDTTNAANNYALSSAQLANQTQQGQYQTQASIYENQANNATKINSQLLGLGKSGAGGATSNIASGLGGGLGNFLSPAPAIQSIGGTLPIPTT